MKETREGRNQDEFETCNNCCFWDGYKGGVCHRFPPSQHLKVHSWGPVYEWRFVQPMTRHDDWCGEWTRDTKYDEDPTPAETMAALGGAIDAAILHESAVQSGSPQEKTSE